MNLQSMPADDVAPTDFPQAAVAEADVASKVRSFVSRHLGRDVPDPEDFFTSGMVSSLFGMQLITFIEKSFACEVTDDDLVLSNFNSVDNICRFVARKRTGQ